MNSTNPKLSFTLPLSFDAHSMAQKLVSRISNKEKRSAVYLNSLAVYVVNNYLHCMGLTTDLQGSDSQNPLAIQLMNVADLIVKNIGKLECLPILNEDEVVKIPLEVWQDRVGYVVVKLNDSLKSARIVGFTPQAAAEVSLSQLQSLSDFLVYLTQLEMVESVKVGTTSKIVNFSQWLDGIIDASWQKLDQLLNPQQLGLAFKNEISVTRGQKIDLGIDFKKISVALVMKVMSGGENEQVDILTQVYPVGEMALPREIKLIISDDKGETVLEVISREDDNWIQSEFSAEFGERFYITLVYHELEVTKEFQV